MKRRIAAIVVVIAGAVSYHAQAQVTGVKAKDAALQAAFEARQKAVDTRNAAEWSKYTADDFFRISVDGTIVSRAEQRKAIAAPTNQPAPVTLDQVQMFGPDAAVTKQRTAGAGTGTNRVTLFWVRQGGAWKVAATVFTPNSGK